LVSLEETSRWIRVVRKPEEIAKENSGISFMDVRRQEPPKKSANDPFKGTVVAALYL
jgi:hypothetical protein